MTYTVATMTVSARTYDEVALKLQEAGYGHAFMRHVEPPHIDMHGIALVRSTDLGSIGSGPTALMVKSQHSAFTVKTALLRAAFHLKKQGYGAEDARMAEVIEQLTITQTEST